MLEMAAENNLGVIPDVSLTDRHAAAGGNPPLCLTQGRLLSNPEPSGLTVTKDS